MSRHGYMDEIDSQEAQWACIRWAGALKKAIHGKPGQAFLKELLAALDALPEKKLIEGELITAQGEVCALGSVMQARGVSAAEIDSDDYERVAGELSMTETLAREIMYQNDEARAPYIPGNPITATPEIRFEKVREWVVAHLKDAPATVR